MIKGKTYLLANRQISTFEGETLAKDKNFLFQEVSAKNGTNINTLFYKEIFNQIKNKFYLSGGEVNNQVPNCDERQSNNKKFYY